MYIVLRKKWITILLITNIMNSYSYLICIRNIPYSGIQQNVGLHILLWYTFEIKELLILTEYTYNLVTNITHVWYTEYGAKNYINVAALCLYIHEV